MIDSHCHLAASEFDSDRDAVLLRAWEAHVSPIVVIADSLDESEKAAALTDVHHDLYSTVGIHPHVAGTFDESSLSRMCELLKHSKVVAIGEIGLDYHYEFSPRDIQKEVFQKQLALARDLHVPAVLHSREAIEDTWTIIDEIAPEKLVLHCCTERFENVERFLDRGYFLSFTGIATYPKSEEVRDTIRQCPLHQLMIETDAPYLAPVPYRGKRNEPAFVVEVAKCVANVKGISLEEVLEATERNTRLFFAIESGLQN